MTTHSVLRQRLLLQAGLVQIKAPFEGKLADLERSEWSPQFERLMRNRLLMGALRYGPIGAPGKPQYDRVRSMIKRLNRYDETGNKEFLVDVANLCLLEFVECHHPTAHFHAIDEHNEHVQTKRK